MVDAFCHLCKCLSIFCNQTVPTPADSFTLSIDASLLGIGGVLSVNRDEEERLVTFYARKLRGAEKRYSATELEALAVVLTVQHFSLTSMGTSS